MFMSLRLNTNSKHFKGMGGVFIWPVYFSNPFAHVKFL